MAYDIFLCHSGADRELARALARALSRRLPGIERSATPLSGGRRASVFLAGDNGRFDTDRDVLAALEQSRYLVLLASSQSSTSAWVHREVSAWLERKSNDSVVVVLAEGEPRDVIPSALSARERVWFDLRWTAQSKDFAGRFDFGDTVLSILSFVTNTPKDILREADARASRRAIQLATTVIVGLVFIIAALAFAALEAGRQRRAAQLAVEQAQQAVESAAMWRAEAAQQAQVARDNEMKAEEHSREADSALSQLRTLRQQLQQLQSRPASAEVQALRSDNQRLTKVNQQLDAQAAAARNEAIDARSALQRAEAAEQQAVYELNLARQQVRALTESPTAVRRTVQFVGDNAKTLLLGSVTVFILLTVSTRWILLLLKLEIKPVAAVAVPFYLTNIGKWRLYRQYRRKLVSNDIRYHAEHYIDLPYDNKGVPGDSPLWTAMCEQVKRGNVVVIAGGGQGKTTLGHKLAASVLDGELQPAGHRVMPVLVDGLAYEGNLVQSVSDALAQDGVYANTTIVESQLAAGNVLVIFDGWSEVRAFVGAQTDASDVPATIRRFPNTRFVFTSRGELPATLQQALRASPAITLRELGSDTLRPFLTRYLKRRIGEVDALERQLTSTPSSLPLSPLMVRLVAAVFEERGAVPTARASLFDNYLHQLFKHERPGGVNADAMDFIVKHLTRLTYLASRGRRGFLWVRGVELIRQAKDVLDSLAVTVLPIVLLNALIQAGVYRRSGNRVRCFHDSFESFFAAKVLFDEMIEGRQDTLAECALDPTFAEVMDFLVELVSASDDADRLLRMVADARTMALTPPAA